MFRYIRGRIARKEQLELEDELTFYEPLYTLVHPFHIWFMEKWDYMWSHKTNQLGMEDEVYAEVYTEIPGQLTVFKQAIADHGKLVNTSYFEEKIAILEKMLADAEETKILTLMFLYMQIFERAERYLYLKKRQAELQKYIR
jgi:hypothetical protein